MREKRGRHLRLWDNIKQLNRYEIGNCRRKTENEEEKDLKKS